VNTNETHICTCIWNICICMFIVYGFCQRPVWIGRLMGGADVSLSGPFVIVTRLGFGGHTLFIAISHHLCPTSDLQPPNSVTHGVYTSRPYFSKIVKWLCEVVDCFMQRKTIFSYFERLTGSCPRFGEAVRLSCMVRVPLFWRVFGCLWLFM